MRQAAMLKQAQTSSQCLHASTRPSSRLPWLAFFLVALREWQAPLNGGTEHVWNRAQEAQAQLLFIGTLLPNLFL